MQLQKVHISQGSVSGNVLTKPEAAKHIFFVIADSIRSIPFTFKHAMFSVKH